MIRNKRFINITMDAFHDHVFVSGSFEKLNLDKIISIGAINPYKSGSSFKKLLSYKNFTGCLDRVWFDGIDMLENARIKEHRFEKNSDVIYNGCKISSISCLNFLTEESNIIANAMPSRFIHFEFDFRTYYTQCSILIHEMSEGKINIEIDKHGQISVYIEGSNKINIKSVIKRNDNYHNKDASLHTKSYSDGLWHTFILDGRSANAVEPAIFNITIDGLNYVSKRMMFYKTGKIYNVGGTNYAAAIVGFIGCIKNIYVGKEKINKWKSNSVNTESCRIVDRCTPNPCEHGGICHQNSFAFFCDCSRTGYEGSVCHKSMYSMSCDEVRRQNPTLKNMKTKIDYDDTGYMEPIEVNCIFFHDEKYSITEISHDSTHRLLIDGYQHPGSYIRNINYNNANEKHFDMITDRASKCEQFISYQCHNTRLLTTTGSHDKTKLTWGWWVGRYGKQLRYWGGGIEGLSMCQCGLIDECPSPNAPCTCDSGDSEEDLHDSGFLNYKEDLPVMQLRFGDSGDLKDHKYAFHKLGKLRCYDDDLYKDVITFFAIDSSIQLETFNTNFTTSSDIRFEFKTTASTGVIIHCKGQTHFIEISILDPNTIQFIFDAGDGAQTLTKVVAYRLNDDMWHTVHVERNHLNSLLKIDYQAQVTLDEPKNREFRYLQLSSKLYIGSSVDNSNGFIGCFRALVINGYIVNLKKIVDGFIKPYGVSTGCNAKCKQNPCLNGGICIEGYSFYKCDCAYTPFRGWNCGREVGIHFQSNWMVRYEFNKITGDISTDEENIIVGFSTEDKQGILMSIQNENGEYITIQVNNNDNKVLYLYINETLGGIRVVLDVGSERDELNNDIFDVDLANGQQHILKVKRSNRGRNLSIQVDDYPIARKYWNLHSSADTKLDFPKYIYFGRNSTDNIRGFKGCLFRIQFNNVYPFRRLFRNPSKNNLKFYPEEDGDRMIESMCGFEEVTPFEEPKYIRGAKEADLRNLEFDIFDLIVKENDNYLFIWGIE
ncbi:Cell recognition molecule Caspr5 [Intoshia linei]|uniref:Cell recognition molecule Caspr5 n=1 Tax=Intoshia linei TaxID=1819745 RepID=A0A177B4Z1_9BILA|nr:Cell recognition molecule Caspr5 [Intoshia linei]